MFLHIVLDRAPTVKWVAVFCKALAAVENDVYCPFEPMETNVNSCKCKRRIQELFNAALSQLPEGGKKSSGCTVNHRRWCLNVLVRTVPHLFVSSSSSFVGVFVEDLQALGLFPCLSVCSAAALQW